MAILAKKAKKKKWKAPRPMSWVKLDESVITESDDKQFKYTETMGEGPYIYFGEIPNMPQHCVVMNRQNKFTIGMHTYNFRELTEDET